MKIKRPVNLDRDSFIYGIQIAAELAAGYDKYSSHPYLVSECILSKLNVKKGKPRRNKDAERMSKIIGHIEKKLSSIEGMTRFIAATQKYHQKGSK